eukprot:CAMPEP_0172509388 /NCGR_PEP_ID=MMETSP1066-20121228/219930_1 /TAXON_ID=671091 /ORGANISM="Coscinodiscus wailesii, Strain CCMP2513" /LENGTH=369 /DNA_ID=CAMNT_0013287843 /DNA_START=108 /DNA_END=1214 /DNA_ORIENTATION=-
MEDPGTPTFTNNENTNTMGVRETSSVKELKKMAVSLQMSLAAKDEEHKSTIQELEDIKRDLKTTKMSNDAIIKNLKEEKNIALVNTKKSKEDMEGLSKSIDDLKAKIAEKENEHDKQSEKIKEMQNEIETWKGCYNTAVQSCQDDSEAQIKTNEEQIKVANADAEEYKKQLDEANAFIDSLENDVKIKDEEHEKTSAELVEVKKELARKTALFETALKECKDDVDSALSLCMADAEIADKSFQAIKAERDSALAEVDNLTAKIGTLNSAIASLENTNQRQDEEQMRDLQEIQALRTELLRSKEEFENALECCQDDVETANENLKTCESERDAALEDAATARDQLRQVLRALRILEKDIARERQEREKSW